MKYNARNRQNLKQYSTMKYYIKNMLLSSRSCIIYIKTVVALTNQGIKEQNGQNYFKIGFCYDVRSHKRELGDNQGLCAIQLGIHEV
jgi:hypothetical protein